MTRYEALQCVNEWIKEQFDPDNIIKTAWHYGKCELKRDINRIYDSLDKEVCTNCKHYNDELGIENKCKRNVIQDYANYNYFGCKLFERKKDES